MSGRIHDNSNMGGRYIVYILQREEGYTLVEVLVAMTIFLIMVIAITTFYLNSYADILTAGKRTAAFHEAQQQMEKAIEDPTYEEEGIERLFEYELDIFGRKMSGTKIIVEKTYSAEHGRKLTLVTFVSNK